MPETTTQPVKQFVRAGAGAGKTYTLTRQVISWAEQFREREGAWPKTVVTTFTRKATQELKERLLEYCLEEKPEALEYVQSPSLLFITTMHGLFDNFLRRHGATIGLPNQFKIIEGDEGLLIRKKIIKSIFVENDRAKSLLQYFDFRRLSAILKDYEKVSLDEDKRFGTIEDFSKYSFLQSQTLQKELHELIHDIQSLGLPEKWDAYISYLQDIEGTLGLQDWLELRERLSKNWKREKKPQERKGQPGLGELRAVHDDLIKKIQKLIDNKEFDPVLWNQSQDFFEIFNEVSQAYCEKLFVEKRKEGLLEADDLETLSQKLITEYPASAQKFKEEWDHWFIDEFQDTSPRQIHLLNAIVEDKPCYMVGDPQQSIYLFRGSRREVFANQQEIAQSQGFVEELSDNYRSSKALLSFFNHLFPAMDRQFSTMNAKGKEESLSPCVQISIVDKDEEPLELTHINNRMFELLQSGVSPKEIAVLTRTRSQLDAVQKHLVSFDYPVIAHSSANYFARREIADALSLLQALLNPWDDFKLIELLRSPWVPLDDQTIVTIIGDHKLGFWRPVKKYFEDKPNFSPGQQILQGIAAVKDCGVAWVFRKLLINLGFFDYTQRIDSTGRREGNLWKLINLIEKYSREPGVPLLKLIEQESLSTDLDGVGDSGDASSPVEPNKINLMTVHASKGLQFEYVFMPFLHKPPNKTTWSDFTYDEEQKIWSFRFPEGPAGDFQTTPLEKYWVAQMSQREAEESLRLLYVGLTRAKKKVFMSWSDKVKEHCWAHQIEKVLKTTPGEYPMADFQYNVEQVASIEDKNYDLSEKIEKPRPPWTSLDRFALEAETKSKAVTEQGKKKFKETMNAEDLYQSQSKRWKGVVVHELFEKLKYHEPEPLRKLIEEWFPFEKTENLKAFDYVVDLKEPPMMDLIRNGEVEWFFQIEKEGEVTEGRVDLWCVHGEELWVVDYKTGSSKTSSKHFPQLEAYWQAINESLGGKYKGKGKLCLVYPFSQEFKLKNI